MPNGLDMTQWKQYPGILTGSLWLFDERDSSGAHLPWYWGNFVPQIPHQLMQRFTQPGDWVLDPFLGSGTTLIECRRLGRHGLGVELNLDIAVRAREHIAQQPNELAVSTDVVVGDSTAADFAALLRERGSDVVQLLLLHPPYWDIIPFSDSDPRDLSHASSVPTFLDAFGRVVDHADPVLAAGGHMAVVIGDKYARGEWVPLGFYVLGEVLQRNYLLKAIIVKNFAETKAKRGKRALWRYRALQHGLYEFQHEYILLFQKPAPQRRRRSSPRSTFPLWLRPAER